jgi:hypothetical protein
MPGALLAHLIAFIMEHFAIYVVVLAAVGALLRWVLKTRTTQYRYPDGPKGIPILGNLLQLPPDFPGQKMQEWGSQYGDM